MALEPKRNISSNQSNAGFTLIELLVVVAIITLLLAIMLPVLSKVRIIANRLACRSNLRQIALAWHTYLNDHDGKFYQDINANMIYGGWKGTHFPGQPRPLNRYLSLPKIPASEKDAKVFRCPGDNGSSGPLFYSTIGTSYQTNILLIGENRFGLLPVAQAQLQNRINDRLNGLKLTSVANPSRMLLIGDYTWGSQWLPPPYPRGLQWHRRCCYFNLAFLDDHVEFIKIHKGLFVTPEYCILPFKQLYGLAYNVQVEEPCEFCD